MSASSYLFTSESVSEGHPDKVCDRISDEVVDLFFREGPKYGFAPKDLRVACETLATTNRVVIAGETRGPEELTADIMSHVARLAIRDIGYELAGAKNRDFAVDLFIHVTGIAEFGPSSLRDYARKHGCSHEWFRKEAEAMKRRLGLP